MCVWYADGRDGWAALEAGLSDWWSKAAGAQECDRRGVASARWQAPTHLCQHMGEWICPHTHIHTHTHAGTCWHTHARALAPRLHSFCTPEPCVPVLDACPDQAPMLRLADLAVAAARAGKAGHAETLCRVRACLGGVRGGDG